MLTSMCFCVPSVLQTISAVVAPMVAAAAPVPEARPLAAAPAHFSADMDVDSADADDPTAVSDYVNEIYQNFQRVEVSKPCW